MSKLIKSADLIEPFFRMICTELAEQFDNEGEGMSRKVYFSDLMPHLVFKFEHRKGYFQNVLEYEFWQQIKETSHAKFFAPIWMISNCGRILAMTRTKPVTLKTVPARMPEYFVDFKLSNYGLHKGRVVCHDYGTCLLPTYGLSNRTKVADWSER